MTNRLDDIPPPPYSETDIYSTSGGDRSPAVPLSPSHHRRGSHNRDNISRSPTSTVDGEIIYTPPLTPRTGSQPSISGSNFNYAGSNSNSNSFSNYVAPTPNTASVTGDHLTTASAQAYFDTRPAPPTRTTSNTICPITVRDDSSPDSFPFPARLFLDKDVTPTDWQTFVNYLIPHFHAENNERVIDRKLRAEGIIETTNSSSNSNDDVHSTGSAGGIRSNNTHAAEAEAQLDQIRSPLVGSFNSTTQGGGGGGGGLSESRRQVVEQTVREWNEGFFGPRGVCVRANTSSAAEDVLHVAGGSAMPGGWDASFDSTTNANGAEANAAAPGNNNNNPRSRFARFMPQFGAPHNFGLGIGGGGPGNTFRLGGIAVDGDRLSIGDRFVADRNGLRIGSFVADNNGISMNGQPMFAGCPPAGAGPGPGPGGPGMRGMAGTWGPGAGEGGFSAGGRGGCRDGGGGPWGRGWGGRHRGHGWGGRHRHGSFGPGPCASFGPGPGPVQDKHHDEHDHDHDHGHGHRERRGRRSERRGRHRSRSRSVDSASSISSSSSSSSESSIGSLPDYDELRDSQLPVARDHLLAWLHDPEQPISKEKLKEFKQMVKEAKNSPANNTINEPVNIRHDQKAMRKEVKALMKEWKDLKKQQTKLRRQLRRERKQQRRAEKRERRNTKREMKRAAKEQKRAARRNGGGGGGSSASLPDVVDPRLPRMPGAFSPPNVPPMPGVPGQARHPWPPNINVGGPFGNVGPNFPPGGPGGFFSPFNFFSGVGGGGQPPQPPSEGTIHRAAAQAPGAWPSGGDENGTNHVSSQEKYKVADELEAQLIEKETELFKLHEAIALAADTDVAASSSSSRGGEPTMSSDARARNEKQMLATRDLEMEVEDLAKQMALMRTEADAEYAKELARMA
ncbi:hypothetical protein QBC37DRAFT_409577 [Rhypophila decipiens]|uniref:Uncharacterized protein n=1 Tax=Rhypophila decipiens TaxID=261697 RepID=A0AAN6YI47_9PEZI|nr:hypothetical protein QBC37DRAFT_409577 [Rhypophila decipiens]